MCNLFLQHLKQPRLIKMKQENVLYIIKYIEDHKSTKTTAQIFNHFKTLDITKELVYSFPYLTKGNVLSYETLLSKRYIESTMLERPEDIDKDICESLSHGYHKFQ
jgi:hypothetical protein